MLNCLYVICDAKYRSRKLDYENNFDLMIQHTSAYMKHIKKYGLNDP